MATPVSEFYAKLGVQVDKKSLKGVDKFFADLEKRLGNVGKPLTQRDGVVSGFKQLTKEVNTLARAEKRRSDNNRVAVSKEIAQNNRLAKSRQKVAAVTPTAMPTVRAQRVSQVRKTQTRQAVRAPMSMADFINRQVGVGAGIGGMSRMNRQKEYESLFGVNSRLNRVGGRTGKAGNVLVNLANKENDVLSGRRAAADKLAAKMQLEAAKRQQQAAKAAEKEAQRAERSRRNREMQEDNDRKAARKEQERQRKEAEKQEEKLRKQAEKARVSEARIRRGNYLAMGGATGAMARYGLASLPFVGGMYGLASLNKANQTLMSTEISSGAIFGERADEAKAWLRQHSDYVGYNYLETMPIFSQFMAAGMNSMGYEKSLGIFEGFSEFGRTRGADKQGMQRGLRAISQMASKGKITAEELRLQLSEATGFGEAVPIFAEAWQILNGGELTGSDATAALFKAMEKGDVYSDKLLPIVGQLLKGRAAGGIDKARTSSIAEQARAENAQTALLGTFSQNGGEAGFARFWQSITWALKELDPLVKGLSGTFERLSVVLQAPIRLIGTLGTAVGYLSNTIGISEKNIVTFAALGGLLMTKWGRLGMVFTGIILAIEDIAFAMMGKDSLTLRFLQFIEKITGFPVDQTKGIFAVGGAFLAIAGGLKAIEMAKKSLPLGGLMGGPQGGNQPGKKGGGLSKGSQAMMAAGLGASVTAAVVGSGPNEYATLAQQAGGALVFASPMAGPAAPFVAGAGLTLNAVGGGFNAALQHKADLAQQHQTWRQNFTLGEAAEQNADMMLMNHIREATGQQRVAPNMNFDIKMDVSGSSNEDIINDMKKQMEQFQQGIYQQALMELSGG